MSDITSWEQCPAALVRRGGYSIADEMLAKAQNLESEKRWLRADWEARMDAADAGSDPVDPFEKPMVASPSPIDRTTAFFQSG